MSSQAINSIDPPRIFELRRHGRLAALLGLTMVAAAITESIGLMLLAPMLAALDGSGVLIGRMAGLTANLGLPLTPAPLLAMFVGLVFLRSLVVYARAMVGQRFEAAVVDSLRNRAWSALLQCEWRKLARMQQSDNASLLISEVDRVGLGVNQGISALASAVTLGGLALAGLAIAPQMALVAALGGMATIVSYRRLRRKAGALGEQLSDAGRAIYAAIGEGLGALRVIKSFGREAQVADEFEANFTQLRAAQRSYLHESSLAQVALQGGGAALLALLVWLALTRWGAGPATIVPLVALFARALPLLGTMQSSWQTWAHCRPAMTATLALIAEAESAREPADTGMAAPELGREIAFEAISVRFATRAQPALREVSFTIPAGRITALAGPSGAGKSTLADLAGGLIAPDHGRVLIDGVALEGGLRRAWRQRVAYVQQDPVLFTGTIRDNLVWAVKSASEAEIRCALSDASAEFVLALPQGLDTMVGESGRQLSGGERQRIVLARALLRRPLLLILDEATSALDAGNESVIAGAIARLRDRMTVLIIGHRGALQAIADQVVTLESGQIVTATPALLAQGP